MGKRVHPSPKPTKRVAAPIKRASTAAKPKISGEHVPLRPEDIGGEVISLLSEGLYKNPLDAFREYIQNSIDAGATRINIKFSGRAVFIRDDGHGMTRDELVRARRLAVSDKSFLRSVGFRGIGIYSAFHICNQMKIRTKRNDGFDEHVATFDFAGMRAALNAARLSSEHEGTALSTLLTDYVTFETGQTHYEDQRTIVELLGISDLYYVNLSSSTQVEKYLLDTVPIDFDSSFPYRNDVNIRLKDYLGKDQQTVTVVLEYKEEPQKTLSKKLPENLETPVFHEVKDKAGNIQAFIWGCRNKEQKKIDGDQAGFIRKLKGFSIGGRDDLRKAFSQSQLYPWWTGEIYILNDKIVPTTARDEFEYSPISRAVDLDIRAGLEKFYRDAQRFQMVSRAETLVDRIANGLAHLEPRAEVGILSPEESYDLIKYEKDASRQASSLSSYEDYSKAVEVKTRALTLRDRLRVLIKAAQKNVPSEDGGATTKRSRARTAPQEDAEPTLFEPAPSSTISDLFTGLDTDDAKESSEALKILLEAVEQAIETESQTYRELFDAIQSRLADELE